jgi:septal ring factor EnvC (AmiA/AmiB activator)
VLTLMPAWVLVAVQAALPASAEPVGPGITGGKASALTFHERARMLERVVADLRSRMVRIARAIQEAEAVLTGFERELATLKRREAALLVDLKRGRRAHAATLAALQRLARRPPEALLAHHDDATRSRRAALLLKQYQRGMAARAGALRRQLATLHDVRTRITARRDAIARTTARLAVDRTRLAVILAKSAALKRRSVRDQKVAVARLKVLASAARNLRELLESVERNALRKPAGLPTVPRGPLLRKPKGVRIFAAAHGKVIVPVRGSVLRRFGEKNKIGASDRGVVFQTRPGAQVVAPFDGRVVFAGRFRSYGLILIIDHGGGYHTLLAGLARVDIVVNQWLLGGEPIGAMSSTQSRSTRLYLEIRRRGQPINPLPWLAAQPSKANG